MSLYSVAAQLLALLLAAPGLLMFLQLDRDRARKDK